MKRFEFVEKSIERFVILDVKKDGTVNVYELTKFDHLKENIVIFGLDIEMLYKTCKTFQEKTHLSKGILIVAVGENGGQCVNMTTNDDFETAIMVSAKYVA